MSFGIDDGPKQWEKNYKNNDQKNYKNNDQIIIRTMTRKI